MLLANVIFPAPTAVYVTSIFFPLATILAMGTEFLIFALTQRGVLTWGRLLAVVLALNVLSWIIGLLLAYLLPTGLVPELTPDGVRIVQPGPQWNRLAILSFPIACVVSAAVEYLGLRTIRRKVPFRAPLRTVVLANVASYIVLAAMVWVHLLIFR